MPLTPLISDPITSTKYLQFVRFRDLDFWDIKKFYFEWIKSSWKYPLVPWREFLSRISTKKISIENGKQYKILWARSYWNGAFTNRVVDGSTLKMRTYQQAIENSLFWCKVDTRNGAFGVIWNDLSDGLGSSNMTFAKIDTDKIMLQYLQLLFKVKGFNEYMDISVTGTTNRKYLSLDQILNDINFPLPDLATQSRIVREYQDRTRESVRLQQLAQSGEKEIESYLIDALGITIENTEKKQGINFVRFRDLERWDMDYLMNTDPDIHSNKFPVISYKEIFTQLRNGISARNYSQKGIRYLLVASIKDSGISDNVLKYVPEESIKKSDLLTNGTLLISRKGTVGEACIYRETFPAVASSEVFIIQTNNTVDLDYLVLLNQSIFCKTQYQKKSTWTIMPSLSQPKLLSVQIPLPPINIQKDILRDIGIIKSAIATARAEAERLRVEARESFERELFA